jgi:hypothetical protein
MGSCYNVLCTRQAAVDSEHQIESRSPGELSLNDVTGEVKVTYGYY